MKKGLGKSLLTGFLAIAMSLFWTVGCSVHGPTLENRLESVPNDSILASLQGTDLYVEWGEVPNATSYLVKYTDTTLTVEAPMTSAVFRYVEYVSGSITISIIACASDYFDSVATSYTFTPDDEDPPTTLFKPTGLSVSDGVLAWTNVKNATSYTVSDGNKSATVNTNSIDLAANGLTVPTSGSITYTVIAKADGYNDSAKASYKYTPSVNPPHTLSKPAGISFSNGTLTWTMIKNATSYTVSDGNKSATVNTNSIDLAANGLTVPTSGSITYTVVAKADGYNDSATASYKYTPSVNPPQPTTLATPTGLAFGNGKLTWSPVKNATSYTVSDGSKSATVNTNSIDLAANGLTVPTSGSITYTVIAKADGYNDSATASYKYTPSVNPPQPTTLATPTGLAFGNGKLTWSPVKNATSYTVSDGNKSATVSTNSINLATNGLTVPTTGSITYTVVAKASGYNDSAKASYKYTPSVNPPQPTTLAMPVGLYVAGGSLSWSSVTNATSYTVSDGTKTVTVNTNTVDLAAEGFNVPDSGSVTYTVVAKASGHNDSPAASLTHQYQHFHTYSSSWESNKTHHWKTITCGHSILIEEHDGYGAHDFGNGNVCSVCLYERSAPILGQYVYFGEYPQTLKAENITVGNTADSNGYYEGSDGEKYAKVTATPFVYYQGFKTKFSNGEWITADTVYYFKVEPIKWRVLKQDDGNAFLFCDSIIDHGAYFDGTDSREIGGATVYPSNYKHSDIRAWLNGTFYSAAFNSTQQQGIQITTVDNSAATTGHSENVYICEDTQDKIFLLSNRESYDTEYGFVSDGTASDSARMLIVSDYARATGAHTSDSIAWAGCGIWWMRSPMWDSATVADSGSMSGMVSSSPVTSAHVGIAPAMWVAKSAL